MLKKSLIRKETIVSLTTEKVLFAHEHRYSKGAITVLTIVLVMMTHLPVKCW